MLDARFEAFDFHIIEHGISYSKRYCFGGAEEGRRLRVGLLGTLGWNKGSDLLRRSFEIWRAIVDFHLVGAHDAGAEYGERWGSHCVHHYAGNELPSLLDQQKLDMILSLHLVPETFSLTLSEAWCFCIPPAAGRLGAHADRIDHGKDGFLFDLSQSAITDLLLYVDRERQKLRRVAGHLRRKPVRTAADAVNDYYRLRSDATGSDITDLADRILTQTTQRIDHSE